jgi:surface polysaccharide O-acyltransferase-like enzyme
MDTGMNKNLIVVLYFGLAAVAVVIACVIAIFAPEQFDRIFNGLLQILGLASTAAVTIYLLGKQATTLEQVKSQTNGTLTKLHEAAAEKDAQIASLQHQLLQVVGNAPAATPGEAYVARH